MLNENMRIRRRRGTKISVLEKAPNLHETKRIRRMSKIKLRALGENAK